MKKKLNYDYGVLLDGHSAAAKVIRFVGSNKKVLEVGAGPGSITKHLAGAGNCDVVALEIDDDAIAELKNFCNKIYKSDLNSDQWTDEIASEGKFDYVVAADVLEHLYNPWKTLQQMAQLLNPDGSIVLSLPHISHSAIFACLVDADFAYREMGLLDKTHIRFFGIHNIEQLVKSAGLKITDADFVLKRPEDTEFSDKWAKLSQLQKEVFTTHKFSNVYQVVINLKALTCKEEAVSLHDSTLELPKVSMQQRVVRIVRRIFSEKTLMKIKSILKIKSRF